MAALGAGPNYDIAAAALAETFLAVEPMAAAQWAGSIGDAGRRKKALDRVFDELAQRDPEQALKISGELGSEARMVAEEAIARARGRH